MAKRAHPAGAGRGAAVPEDVGSAAQNSLATGLKQAPPPAAGRYGVILADPPWTFATYSSKGKGRSAEAHYDCLTLDQIAALPVGSWAARDAVLYLWCTVPHLVNALGVMTAWGFGYKSGFVWVKDRIGTGYWARNRHEHLLIGARGSKVCPGSGGSQPRIQ